MVYLVEKFDKSSVGNGPLVEPCRSLERGGLVRGGLWRLDEILPAAVDDLLTSLVAGSGADADGVAEFAEADDGRQVADLPGRSQTPCPVVPMLSPISADSHESSNLGGAVSVF
jgi:hypothetical protein